MPTAAAMRFSGFKRWTHADALHQAGRRAEAETRFREVEQMQAKDQPEYPLLYALRGFQYCDLLLAAPERAAWQIISGEVSTPEATRQRPTPAAPSPSARRRRSTGAVRANGLLNTALDHLTLGRAALYAAILEYSRPPTSAPLTSPTLTPPWPASAAPAAAIISPGLLTRAWLRFLTGARTGPESAQADLDEAWEIAERGPMKLFLADIHLHRARLFGRLKAGGEMLKYPWESPAADLAAAEKLITTCGYHRRDQELAAAKHAIFCS